MSEVPQRRLLGLVNGLDHVCCRYRLDAFVPYLASRGWQVDRLAIPRPLFQRMAALRSGRDADAVLLQRKLLDPLQLGWLRAHARRLIFDFDDAIYQRDSFAAKGPSSRRLSSRFRRTLQAADLVLAGNAYLAERARCFIDASRLELIPTCVDPSAYPLRAVERPAGAVGLEMVWIGSASTVQALERSRAMLEEIGRALPGARLKVLCDRFPRFDHLLVEPVAWSSAAEVVELSRSDVGISITLDDDWSRGKCGLKVLQYMAASLPVVASPVGVNADMVEHGRSGFLAASVEEWVAALRTLHGDPQRARAMGRRGREIVEERYSVARWAPVLERAVSR